jgi:ribonucleoside-triphosphate reductase
MTLAELPPRWKAEAATDHDGNPNGYVVEDTKFDTVHNMTEEAFGKLDLNTLNAVTARGRDVDHVTRVTGYFSKVSGFNKGKQAELRDRYRSGI